MKMVEFAVLVFKKMESKGTVGDGAFNLSWEEFFTDGPVQERPADLVSPDIDDGVDDDTEALHLSSLKGKGSKVSSQGKLRCIMVAS
jgi:hypothetical protein